MAKNIKLEENDLGKQKLKNAADDLGDAKRVLGSSLTYSALRSVRFEDGSGAANFFSEGLASEISGLSSKVQKLQSKLEAYKRIMDSAEENFERIDKSYKKSVDWGKYGLKFLGKVGYFGGILSATISLFTNKGKGASGWVSFLKNCSTIAKTSQKWAKSTKNLNKLLRFGGKNGNKLVDKYVDGIRHKRLFGLNNIPSNLAGGKWSQASKWGSRFKTNLKAQNSFWDDLTAGGSKSAWTVAGVGLDLAANGISNYDEYKRGEISGKRAVAETITETAIDVGKDFLIGAAVTAGIAATVGSAPVLAVGVATVAVSAGLDWATKKITYALTGEAKGFTEAASDLILDGAAAAGKALKSAGKKIGNIVKNALPKIKAPKFKLGKLCG